MINFKKFSIPWALQIAIPFLILVGLSSYYCFWFLDNPSWHPDHVITYEVMRGMHDMALPLSSWHKFDLPDYFRYGQTNFSGYHTVLFVLNKLFGGDIPTEASIYTLNKVFLLTTITLIYTAAVSLRINPWIALLVCVSYALNFQIFLDAQYYRPENFVSLVFGIFLWGLLFASKMKWLMISAVFYGVLLATKISFIILAPFILAVLLISKVHIRIIGLAICLSFLATILFNMSIVFEFHYFVDGIEYLLNQYNGAHFPYGLPNGSTIERLLLSLRFSLVSNALVVAIALAGLFSKNWNIRIASLMLLIVFIYFGAKPVFFIRNITFLNIAAILIFVLIWSEASTKLRRVMIGWSIVSAVVGTLNIIVFKEYVDLKAKDMATLNRPDTGLQWIFTKEKISQISENNPDKFLAFFDAGHPAFQDSLQGFLEKNPRWHVYHNDWSQMWYFPASTLQVYHHPGRVYLEQDWKIPFQCEHGSLCPSSFWNVSQGSTVIAKDALKGSDYNETKAPNFKITGTFTAEEGDSATGVAQLKLNSAPYFYYNTGPDTENLKLVLQLDGTSHEVMLSPTAEWRTIDVEQIFGSKVTSSEESTLTVTLTDEGDGWGQWIAVATPDN